MLKNIEYFPVYASGQREPSDFFIDCLMESQRFDLGLGYFRSTGFKSLAIGFATFLQNGGSMRFIINDSLTEKDKAAILSGQENQPNKEYEQELINDIKELTKTLTKRDEHFFNCLSWLISSERFQIIAVKPKKNKVGIVHHKFGIFTDDGGNQAVFNGSVNFSQYALEKNVETIWCEYSWEADGMSKQRIAEMLNLFEDTWEGRSEAVRIIPIKEVKEIISKRFPKKNIKELVSEECILASQLIEEYIALGSNPKKAKQALERLKKEDVAVSKLNVLKPNNKWRHQDEAVSKFLIEERGVLNMATGTGKTRTALKICEHLIDTKNVASIIVACDGVDLLDQWYKQLLQLVSQKNMHWSILKQYKGMHESERFRNNQENKILLISRMQLHLVMGYIDKNYAKKMLLIHDEVHKLGSKGSREKLNGLSDTIRYRLGLSATPEREYDQEGNEFITDHIGAVIFEFGLDLAIKRGILTPFNYYPNLYQPTKNDRNRIRNVYSRRAASAKAGTPISEEEFRNAIAKVYKTAEGKIPEFSNFIDKYPQLLERCIIFVETKEYGEQILNIVHRHRTDFHSYFGGDDSSILSRFSRGKIECLLTCHRLSEGIDIPSLQNVILVSSSRTKLETIQRIGRCLRIDSNNSNKIANVVDFIRTNEKNNGELNADQLRQEYLQKLATVKPNKIEEYD